jgi:transcription elongation factor GreB
MSDEVKNYITPGGYRRLQEELARLWKEERPPVVTTVAWAAGNGDRSENGDYIYGKKRLREIDRRVRFLIKRLESAEVVESAGRDTDQVFFGATVRVRSAAGERTVTILGLDEVDPARGIVSWISPIAKALIKAREGDTVTLRAPSGEEKLEILEVSYPA